MNEQELYDLERSAFWEGKIPQYWELSPSQKKNAKRYYNQTRRSEYECKKESAMYGTATNLNITAPAPSTESDERMEQRTHLQNRLWMIKEVKTNKARNTFGITDDNPPTTPQEIVDRIKAGNFVISKDWTSKMEEYVYSPRCVVDYIRWRDPAKVEDKAGYKKWKEEVLHPQYTLLKDSIAIKDPECALKELHEWENMQ